MAVALDTLDPALASSWIARGRRPAHASAIAAAWRDFPDLPHSAAPEERMARFKARGAAMREVNDAIAAELEAEIQARNFASVESREGEVSDRDVAILRGRDQHGYDWHLCNRYADGWYAAHTGSAHKFYDGIPGKASLAERRAAYDQGFSDGGGDRGDLFDVARRSYLAQLRRSNSPVEQVEPVAARPLPSTWPKPSDKPRPARWSRRLVIISQADIGGDQKWDHLEIIRRREDAREALILVLTSAGFVEAGSAGQHPLTDGPVAEALAAQQLRDAIGGREFDDVLVGLQGEELALLDRISNLLPLCRNMELLRNSKILRRSYLNLWLDRGLAGGVNMAGGHIRWGKVIHGLSAKLGEFTVRHVGGAPGGGHLVRVETKDGGLANGFATANGAPLSPEIVVRAKARLRAEITAALRTFGAATSLMAATPHGGEHQTWH